jgi:hypothetical protein
MRLPVDTRIVNFVSAGPARPAVEFDTKQPRASPSTRATPFVLGDGDTRKVITVKMWDGVWGLGQTDTMGSLGVLRRLGR